MPAGLAINDALLEADARRGGVKSGVGEEKSCDPVPASSLTFSQNKTRPPYRMGRTPH